MPLSLAQAERLLATTTHDPHLLLHARNVRGCMEAFARHFDQPPEEVEHWGAVGYLHDYDYELFPEEHLKHTEAELLAEGVAREFLKTVQNLRKEADFVVDQRITTAYAGDEAVRAAVEAHKEMILGETLADACEPAALADGVPAADLNGHSARIAVAKA